MDSVVEERGARQAIGTASPYCFAAEQGILSGRPMGAELLAELAVLHRAEEQVELLGALKRPMREALDVLLARKCATSAELSEALDKNVNIVCNRLNALQRLGLVCRLRDGSVAGGGRQYYYVSIL